MTEPVVKRTYVDGPFGQVHCRVAMPQNATRPPLVLLHMSPKSSREFDTAMPFLARDRIVIAPDNPGHGESDPTSTAPSINDFARSCVDAVTSITSEPAHLLGYHTGSMVAVEMATMNPDSVLSLTLVSAPIFSERELEEMREYFTPIPIDEEGSRFSIQWQKAVEHRGPGMTLEMVAESYAENMRGGENYEWGHQAAFDYSSEFGTKLAALDHAIFVMNPADSCYEATLRCDDMLKNGHRANFPEWGQELFMAYPEDSARTVLNFIEQHEY